MFDTLVVLREISGNKQNYYGPVVVKFFNQEKKSGVKLQCHL